MDKIEMFFGLSRKGELDVSNFEFINFLEDCVTPRFPDGLTVLDGYGQWKVLGSGQIIREACKVLILVVEAWQNAEIQKRVYDIRNAYCQNYDQESVLVTVSALNEVSF